MHHDIGYRWSNGKHETRLVDFIHYGEINGQTAMAKTVGFPTAIAAKMVLESNNLFVYLKLIYTLLHCIDIYL
jgi:hypothetical protein